MTWFALALGWFAFFLGAWEFLYDLGKANMVELIADILIAYGGVVFIVLREEQEV